MFWRNSGGIKGGRQNYQLLWRIFCGKPQKAGLFEAALSLRAPAIPCASAVMPGVWLFAIAFPLPALLGLRAR
jgi:hypothetical protein